MRRLLTFGLYTAMIVSGAFLLDAFLEGDAIERVGFTGGFLLIYGCYLVWIDFLAPPDKREPQMAELVEMVKESGANDNRKAANDNAPRRGSPRKQAANDNSPPPLA